MSIQIIDNFYLNSAKPIDNRFVVGSQSFYTHRDFIDWKYVGMRVWDLNDGVNGMPYVWTGTTYSSENSISIGGSGTVNQLPKFVTTTTVGDSNIYDDGTYVGISNATPAYKLDVTGSIRASANLYGAASDPITGAQTITNINADAITGGTLLLNRLQNSSNNNWILTSGNPAGSGQSTWTNPTTITVGNATTAVNSTNASYASQINIISSSTNTTAYLLFSTTTGNSTVYTNTSNTIKINPSNGRVTIGTSTSFAAGLRVTAAHTGSFDTFNAGWATGYNNFRVQATSTTTAIRLESYTGGSSASSSWVKYTTYDDLVFQGRTYINLAGTGTSDSRLITFGVSGVLNDQVRFYMVGNSATVPTVGGYGVYIDRNLQVAGTFSADRLKISATGFTASTAGSGRNFANDTAAAAGGISLGEFYHNAGALRVRIV